MIEIFLMTEQPVTCPLCGARAEIMIEFELDYLLSQLGNCSNAHWRFVFIEQEDKITETQ
jgi:hypothetical protein